MTTNQDNIKLLEKLYTRTVKAGETYHNASKNVHNKLLTEFFEKAGNKHDQFAEDLNTALGKMGSEVDKSKSVKINTDQFWQDFASIIVHRNESAMLKSCLKAEEKAIANYDAALEKDEIDSAIKEKVRSQRDYAKRLSVEVASLEKQYASD